MMKQIYMMAAIVLASTLFGGCDTGQPKAKSTKAKLPKMKFHRPKSFEQAVARLDEIHKQVIETEKEPAPTKFKIIEIIHGEGAGAHSHFYLDRSDEGIDPPRHEEEDHEEMKETVEKHEVEIPISTEFVDIVGWLPNLAAASDMEEEAWNDVSKLGSQIEVAINSSKVAKMEYAQFHKAYVDAQTEITECLDKLKSMSKNSEDK